MMRCQTDSLYKFKAPFFLLISLILFGCETELPADAEGAYGPLRIIGSERLDLYIGSRLAIEYGAAGGQAPYRYRYLKSAPENSGFEGPEAENTLDLSIEVVDGDKPAFILRGVPDLEGENFDGFASINSAFYLEISDGANTVVQEIEYTLLPNELEYPRDTEVGEGRESLSSLSSAITNIRAGNGSFYCKTIKEAPFPTTQTVSGLDAFAVVFPIDLKTRSNSKVTFAYRLTSSFADDLPEISTGNRNRARPGVDFIEQTGELEFEPGEFRCFITVYVMDDQIIEEDESFNIEITERTGAQVQYDAIQKQAVLIEDDEPVPEFSPTETTANIGDFVSIPVIISADGSGEEFHFFIDEEDSTAQQGMFDLVPGSGAVVFPAGVRQTSLGVDLVAESTDPISGPDRKIVLISELDDELDLDESIITINEWPRDFNPNNEIVDLEDEVVSVKAIASDTEGRVFALKQAESLVGDGYLVLSAFNRDGTVYPLTADSDNIVIQKAGVNIEAKGIEVSGLDNGAVAVLSEVDGLFGSSYLGKQDFVLSSYFFNSEGLLLEDGHFQFGTEESDTANGIEIYDNFLYVYGQTAGLVFDGVNSDQVNRGGQEGFVYKLEYGDTGIQKIWSRFLGDSGDNGAVGLGVGRTESYALVLDDLDGTSATIKTLDSNGNDAESVDELELGSSLGPNEFSKLVLDQAGDQYFVLSHGLRNPSSGLPMGSGTQDVAISRATTESKGSSSSEISTTSLDFAVDAQVIEDRELLAVVGDSDGVFEGQLSQGGQDVFYSVFAIGEGVDLQGVRQFGTPGKDRAIDIEAFGDSKFLVLWSEDHTSGDGSLTYRISAFAPDGRKLSPDP